VVRCKVIRWKLNEPEISQQQYGHLLDTNPQGRPWPLTMATSSALPGYRIGQADNPNRSDFGLFAKKSLSYLVKSTRSSASSLRLFYEKIQNFFQINPQSNLHCSRKFAKKPLSSQWINPWSCSSPRFFLEKPSNFNLNQTTSNIICTIWAPKHIQIKSCSI
jgi:hypothetical protein